MTKECKETPLTASVPETSNEVAERPFNREGVIYYKVRKFEQCNIKNSEIKDFKQSSMRKVSAKNGVFVGFDFRYADMEDCYFHQAKFENCDFTGAKFRRCNFRAATFERCQFNYISIDETPIDYKQVIRLIPDEPNIAQEILQALRRNAVTLGEMKEARTLTLLEVAQEQEHLRRALRGNGQYYKKKEEYHNPWNKTALLCRLINLHLSSIVWGHGERVHNILISSLIIISILSIISAMLYGFNSPNMAFADFPSLLWRYLIKNCMEFLGATSSDKLEQNAIVSWLLAFSRLVLTGMFVATIFRKLSRR